MPENRERRLRRAGPGRTPLPTAPLAERIREGSPSSVRYGKGICPRFFRAQWSQQQGTGASSARRRAVEHFCFTGRTLILCGIGEKRLRNSNRSCRMEHKHAACRRLSRVVLVGDRGMLTEARIREEVEPGGLDWISALRGPAIRALVESGAVQLSLFDERDLVEVTSDAYPGERLMVCRNPLLAEERARKRAALLDATEAVLAPIAAATRREKRRLRGESKIGARVGKVIARYKMAKHFEWSIDEKGGLTYRRNASSIAAEAALDGLYVVRTSVPETELDAHGTVRAYKCLSTVERAFRSLKTVDLKVRPVFHRSAERVRAHVLLCMLAYYVEWHMRQRLSPMLFDDEDREAAEAARTSIVAPAQVSDTAQAKARTKRTAEGDPVQSFRTLLADLATVTRNTVAPRLPGAEPFEVITRPTPLQDKALKLLGVRLSCSQ